MVMALYNTGSLTIYAIKKQKDQLRSFMSSSKSVKSLFKQQPLKQPKIAQVDKVLCKWLTEMCSEGKPMIGPMIPVTEKANSFYEYDEMKISGMCTFS